MNQDELNAVVARLRKQGHDDAEYEAKSCASGLSKDVWESVSAFGNTNGGTLLLGIDEKAGFQFVDSFPLDRVVSQFVEGIGDGGKDGKKIENPPQYDLNRVDFENGQVLVIEISEVETRFKPCYIAKRGLANGAYKRVDDKDIKLSATEVFELQHILVPSPADKEAVVGAELKDLNEASIDLLLAAEQEKGSKAIQGVRSREEALRRLNVTTSDGLISLAGLLCMGNFPQQFYPKLMIDVAAHPGIKKSTPDGPRFLDRVICEGSIGEMIDEALLAVAKNLRTFSYVEGSGRRDELEIPREVLREAIANAVIHREYGKEFLGQAVSIDIFSDRVEITNPGGLWGGKTIKTLSDGQSRCRNDSLIRLAARMQRSGEGAPVEGQGSGIPLMIHEMRSRALDEPRFEANIDHFKVVLQRGGAEIVRNKEWLIRVASRETNSKEDALLLELRRRNRATVPELHATLGYDSDEIRQILSHLRSDGLVAEQPTDTFFILEDENGVKHQKITSKEAILQVLSKQSEPIGVKEIARLSGRKISTLRAQIASLVADGEIIPTAPQTDRNRKYYLAKKKE